MSRQKAYQIIQSAVMGAGNSNIKFIKILKNNNNLKKYINSRELTKLLYSKYNIINLERIFQKVFKNS